MSCTALPQGRDRLADRAVTPSALETGSLAPALSSSLIPVTRSLDVPGSVTKVTAVNNADVVTASTELTVQ